MTKHQIHRYTGWRKQHRVPCYDAYLKKDIADGKLDPSYEVYIGSTNKRNSKSLFGPITY